MAERRKIYERVSGSRMQNQEFWFLDTAEDGTFFVAYQSLCRDKEDNRYKLVDEQALSVSEVMSQGGKLAKNLWYAMPK